MTKRRQTMSEEAFRVIVVVLLVMSNLNTFLIWGTLTLVNKNTEWGRYILPAQLFNLGGKDNGKENTER